MDCHLQLIDAITRYSVDISGVSINIYQNFLVHKFWQCL